MKKHPFSNLLVGSVVMVEHDDGQLHEHTVRTAPWQLGHGDWVVGLSGISGGYSLDRVVARLRERKMHPGPFGPGVTVFEDNDVEMVQYPTVSKSDAAGENMKGGAS